MKEFRDLLFFEPNVEFSDWPMIIEALKVVYPNIRWRSGGELETFTPSGKQHCNGLIINKSMSDTPLLSWGVWANKEDFAEHALGINWDYGDIKDGWDYLGFKQEFDFDSLTESIRRIIKESIDEFEWVDVDPNTYNSGQGLYNLIQHFLKTETNGKYYLRQDQDIIEIWDDTGIYYMYNGMENFTIDNIVRDFKRTLDVYDRNSPKIKNEYQQLAKVLEPIIGPIN